MSREKSLAKNTVIFAIGNLGSKLLVLLLLPFCTYYIDPSGMGVFDLLYSIIEVLKTVAVMAIPESLFRWLLDKNANIRAVFASWTSLLIALLSIFSVIFVAAWAIFRFSDALMIYALIVTGACYMGLQFATRGLHHNKLFATQGIVYSLALCISSLIYVIPLGMDYFGLLLGILTGNIIASGLMIAVQFKNLSFSLGERDKELQKGMFKYSALLLPNTICWWLVNSFGRIIVTVFLGTAANGIFAIAARFPSALNMVAHIFYQAWTEQAIGEFDAEDRDRYFSKIFFLYGKLMLSIAIILVPFTKLFIDLFLESSYIEACQYIGILYLSSVIGAFSSFFGTGYLCGKDTKGAATTTVFGAIATCLVGLTLVIPLGIYGVAISMLVGQTVIWLVRIKQSRQYFHIKIQWSWMLTGIAVCIALALVIPIVNDIATAILLAVAISVAVFFNREVLRKILSMLHRKKAKETNGKTSEDLQGDTPRTELQTPESCGDSGDFER